MRAEVAQLAGVEPAEVGDDDDLVALGLDSIGVMRLASTWQRAGAAVSFAELIEWRTLGQWWRVLSGAPAGALGTDASQPQAGADGEEPFPLATMQYAYWVGRADGQPLGGVGAHFYNEFDGREVDPDRLDRAVRALLRRHGMLRARFTADGRQQIMPDSLWPGLIVHDLRGLDPAEVDRRLTECRDRISHRRLRVADGEVFDIQLSLLPGGRCRTHVHIEMLVADAQSFRVLLADLARLYERPDEPPPPLSYSYPRYLAALGPRRQAARERDRAYWRGRLAELPGAPELPLAAAPEQVASPKVTRRHHLLAPDQWAGLRDQAHHNGLTLPAVLLTAFCEVLAAWSGRPRFLLNLPLYDRESVHPEVPQLVGDFTNLLLLDADLSAPLPFAEQARRLQERLRADVAHAAYSGVEVLRDLSRAGGRPMLVPVVFTSALGLGELFDAHVRRCFGTPGWTSSQTPQVWLDYQVTEREGGLFLNWDVVEELFAPGSVDAMFGAYLRILEWLQADAANWTRPVPDPLPADQRGARAAINATDAPAPRRSLHHAFFALAAREPDRPALLWDGGRCGYAELATSSLRFAGALRRRGLRPGDLVGVTLPKGPDQVAAVLGVLAAGGTYVPVGVDQPAARLRRVYAAAGPRLLVAESTVDGAPPAVTPAEARAADPLPAPEPCDPGQPAYVIYTSGSTGEPKGVVVSHAAAANTIDAINDRWRVGPEDRVLAVSALDFDLSVYDIFGLLAAGGAIVLVGEAERRDAGRWLELVRRHRVTIWQSVPVLLDMLLTAASGASGTLGGSLRLALVGGDWVGTDLPGRLTALCPDARFAGLGGTTETAIHSTFCEVSAAPAHWRAVPYGVPLRNVRCRVVDARGRDCPDWVAGELWIGGDSVAEGYRGDPDRTAERFVARDGVRWYRTGDLARYWPDGTLEFLGRADFQIKLRGHRIELGEVEAVLRSCPGVGQAVAVLVDGPSPRLAAAVVPAAGSEVEPAAVARLAADQLPGYMVPERIGVLERLPLSSNGKVDRPAVAALVAGQTGERPAEPPRGPVEAAVAAAWAGVLGVPEVSRDGNFFTLGGDSLLATRLVSRLSAAGVTGATLAGLFAAPVFADFAAPLGLGAAAPHAPLTADLARRHEPFPPTDVQRAYWMGRKDDFALGGVGSHWYWEFDGEAVDLARLEEALNRLVARHEMLRVVFDADGRQRILPTVPRLEIPVLVGADEAALAERREAVAHRVPDPSRWPLTHVWAARYGQGRTRIGFSFDYIALDALSIVIVFAELSALYRDLDAELPPVRMSFRDYVLAAPPADEVERAGKYWTARLSGLPPAPRLPLRVDPAHVTAPRFVRREARLSPDEWRSVTERAKAYGLTPAAVLLTAYAEVLAAYGDRPECTVNLTLFDRRDVHPDIDRAVGDFTSLLLVAYQPAAGEGFLDAVRRTQGQLWADMEHRAVSALWVLRELARHTGDPTAGMPVVFTSALGVARELADLTFPFGELVWGLSQTPQVWLDCQVMERAGGLAVNWDAAEELFQPGVLDAMFDQYVALLRRMAASDWAAPVPSLLPAGQATVRARVNDTAAPSRARALHDRLFAVAARDPDRPALIWDAGDRGAVVTYGELVGRALRVGALLREHGVCPGDVVGVTLPKGPDQVAAVLGILAAGGAYVPVGLEQPAHRRDRIYRDAGVRLALTGAGDVLAGCTALPIGEAAGVDPLPATVPVTPDALAYVIYTSGSTGDPKGVEIEHRAAANTVDDVNERYGIGPADRVLAVSALDFDLSVYDIFGLLGAGGAVVLVAEDDRREARRWAELVRRHGVTVWNSVPALLDMILVAARPGDLATLRCVLASGDWVGLDLPERLAAAAQKARFIALGGATEAAIWSNAYEVPAEVPAAWRSVPYGYPLRNQRFRVVDERGRDRPDWVPGELWIGGHGVARGYRGDPERTAERFVRHEGERWYRTGDLGRYWPDGTLEFLGRADTQVKVRGHRIELGEVEAALAAHPAVSAAVAAVVGDGTGRRVAAAVLADGGPVDAAALRSFAADRLPPYAVPDPLLAVDEFPLTSNGKVDRRALARRLAARHDTGLAAGPDDGAAPRTPVEHDLAEMWSRLLGVSPVGRESSFFALGGDSISATRLAELVRRRYGIALPLRELLAAPTVAQLAALVTAAIEDPDVEEGDL
ncbi:amino acid adenylation domain-containing protein [Micromonospora sp. CPCC 206061]|uniref:amino acid adenylation domain-containing protein n=1 Tax=Micromonospora sp. CPCC 206061 TaxID=3122410 RepID=UPI002FF14170